MAGVGQAWEAAWRSSRRSEKAVHDVPNTRVSMSGVPPPTASWPSGVVAGEGSRDAARGDGTPHPVATDRAGGGPGQSRVPLLGASKGVTDVRSSVVALGSAGVARVGVGSSRSAAASRPETGEGLSAMPFVTTGDGTEIFYKDWGSGQPIVFHHGWPLSSDDWDAQMMFFVLRGYRVVAHDRRGHGRSTQTSDGHDMDTYAADAAAVVEHLDLRDAVHVGHSTGGGEVARYVARHGAGRVAKAVLIGAVPPLMLKTDANPGGLPIEVFNSFREGTAFNRAQFFLDVASGPFYGFNRPGAEVSEGVIRNWWRQGMMGGVKAHYEGIKAFSETDFTEDLKVIDVPTLVMHGDDDQVVPIADSAELSIKLLKQRHPQGVSGLLPRDVHDQRRRHQRRRARIHPRLTGASSATTFPPAHVPVGLGLTPEAIRRPLLRPTYR